MGKIAEQRASKSTYYRTIWWQSVILGVIVTVVGIVLDVILREIIKHQLGIVWLEEHIVTHILEGIAVGLIASALMRRKYRRLERRFKEVGYLNHHIRNALAAIVLAEDTMIDVNTRVELVRKSAERITQSLEKISREEDLSDIDKHPDRCR